MCSNYFENFNSVFPNSKYREINKQYTDEIITKDDHQKYQDSKRPINTKILTFDEIKNTTNRVGWIVPKDYIVIDIDNKNTARIVFDILQATKIKFSFMTGLHGGHFIFKNQRKIPSISAGKYCSLGVKIDVRCNEKGYIILPENDTDRTWGNISNEIDDIPYYLVPLQKFRTDYDVMDLDNGDGRNDILHRHILGLIDYANELTLNEKTESIRLINRYFFKTPLSDVELQKTVLRDDILKKENKKLDEEKGCYEEKLAARIVNDKQIICSNNDFYIWNGKYYKKVLDVYEIERMIHLEYNSSLKDTKRKEVIKFIGLKSWIAPTELNKSWNEIVFKNGVLNLATMKLMPHTPSVYNTIYIDCNYIPDAPYSKLIDDFFNQISSKETDKKTLLYEIIGYCLIRKNVFEKFFICYGEGATGKSTYLKMIRNLIGDQNSAFLSLNNLEEQFMPANLFGKLINIGDDIAYRGLKESDVLKKLVTGEMFAAQQKYLGVLNFANFAKLIFTTNKLPEVYDRSSGFYRRVVIIDINKKIENPDPFFLDRLTEQDYEYLLSTAIDKLIEALKRNALTDCLSSQAKLIEYKKDQSSVLSFLSDFNYKVKHIDHRPCGEVYREYEQYCRDVGFKPLKKVNFDKELCYELNMTKKNTTRKGDENILQTWRYIYE